VRCDRVINRTDVSRHLTLIGSWMADIGPAAWLTGAIRHAKAAAPWSPI